MKPISKEVKLQKKVVATIEIPQYETVEEIGTAIDPKLLISMVNRMLVTDATNQERAKHRESAPGKGKQRMYAINLLPTFVFADGESGMDKLRDCAGDIEKLDALLMGEELQAAVAKSLGVEPEVEALTEEAAEETEE